MTQSERGYLIQVWVSARREGMLPEWGAQWAGFVDWVEQNLGPRPSPDHRLYRPRPGDWEPGNIEWMTPDDPELARPSGAPSYHDLYVTAPGVERARLADLPYGMQVTCDRTGAWRLWDLTRLQPHTRPQWENARLLGGEFDGPDKWLVLEVAGHVIVDSKNRPREDDSDGEHRQAAAQDRTGADAADSPGGGTGA